MFRMFVSTQIFKGLSERIETHNIRHIWKWSNKIIHFFRAPFNPCNPKEKNNYCAKVQYSCAPLCACMLIFRRVPRLNQTRHFYPLISKYNIIAGSPWLNFTIFMDGIKRLFKSQPQLSHNGNSYSTELGFTWNTTITNTTTTWTTTNNHKMSRLWPYLKGIL